MTVKELINYLEEFVYMNSERKDYAVKMVGYDAIGERHYDIDINDIFTDSTEKTVSLWN